MVPGRRVAAVAVDSLDLAAPFDRQRWTGIPGDVIRALKLRCVEAIARERREGWTHSDGSKWLEDTLLDLLSKRLIDRRIGTADAEGEDWFSRAEKLLGEEKFWNMSNEKIANMSWTNFAVFLLSGPLIPPNYSGGADDDEEIHGHRRLKGKQGRGPTHVKKGSAGGTENVNPTREAKTTKCDAFFIKETQNRLKTDLVRQLRWYDQCVVQRCTLSEICSRLLQRDAALIALVRNDDVEKFADTVAKTEAIRPYIYALLKFAERFRNDVEEVGIGLIIPKYGKESWDKVLSVAEEPTEGWLELVDGGDISETSWRDVSDDKECGLLLATIAEHHCTRDAGEAAGNFEPVRLDTLLRVRHVDLSMETVRGETLWRENENVLKARFKHRVQEEMPDRTRNNASVAYGLGNRSVHTTLLARFGAWLREEAPKDLRQCRLSADFLVNEMSNTAAGWRALVEDTQLRLREIVEDESSAATKDKLLRVLSRIGGDSFREELRAAVDAETWSKLNDEIPLPLQNGDFSPNKKSESRARKLVRSLCFIIALHGEHAAQLVTELAKKVTQSGNNNMHLLLSKRMKLQSSKQHIDFKSDALPWAPTEECRRHVLSCWTSILSKRSEIREGLEVSIQRLTSRALDEERLVSSSYGLLLLSAEQLLHSAIMTNVLVEENVLTQTKLRRLLVGEEEQVESMRDQDMKKSRRKPRVLLSESDSDSSSSSSSFSSSTEEDSVTKIARERTHHAFSDYKFDEESESELRLPEAIETEIRYALQKRSDDDS
jgi:hypothetical protein